MNFAKLFQYESGQLLVTLENDFAPESITIIFRTDTPALSVIKKYQTEDVKAGVKVFDDFNEPKAKTEFEKMQKYMGR